MRRCLPVLIASLLTATAPAPAQDAPEEQARRLLEDGRAYRAQGKLKQAPVNTRRSRFDEAGFRQLAYVPTPGPADHFPPSVVYAPLARVPSAAATCGQARQPRQLARKPGCSRVAGCARAAASLDPPDDDTAEQAGRPDDQHDEENGERDRKLELGLEKR